MRLLLLNQYFPPDGAASAQLLADLTDDLATDHDVWVIAGRPSYNLSSRSSAPAPPTRVHVRRMWATSFARDRMIGRVANYLSFLTSSIAGALVAPRPDVVMTWTDPPPITAVGALVARLRRVPFVLVCQDIVPGSVVAAGELSNPMMIRVLSWLARFGFRHADTVVAIGDDMRDRLIELGVPAANVVTIRNWADGSKIRPPDGETAFRREQGWTDRFVVMHSGNLGMGQDLTGLIEAAALLRDEPDILFAIVGEGIRKPDYHADVASRGLTNVAFLPFQPKEHLASSLGAADVQVVAHRRGMEGYQVPSKLYGMLAIGAPCLAAVVPTSEVAVTVRDAACGEVVAPDDPEAIAAAILGLRDHPDERREMGRRARTVFDERYDRPLATAAYRLLLEGVAGQERS